MRSRVFALSLFVIAGCDDPLKPVDIIQEPRVLAARMEVEGAPERQSPAPGEAARVRWLLAAPDGDAEAGFALVACPSLPLGRNDVSCTGSAFASVASAPSATPVFDFSVPSDVDVSRSARAALLGVLCPGASGQLEAEAFSCASGEALPVRLDFELASAERSNLNPSFTPDSLSFAGAPWPEQALPSGDCRGSGLRELSASSGEQTLRVTLPPSAREELVQLSSADPARETLTLSHFASAGDLSSAFSVIPSNAEALSAELRWAPPGDAVASGTLVHFWFVVRDGRAGSDFTERAVCVVP